MKTAKGFSTKLDKIKIIDRILVWIHRQGKIQHLFLFQNFHISLQSIVNIPTFVLLTSSKMS